MHSTNAGESRESQTAEGRGEREESSTELDTMRPNPASIVVEGLTRQQEMAAEFLLAGKTTQEIATTLGVHRSTLWNWRQLPAFEAYSNRLRQEAKQDTAGALLSMYQEALRTVQRVLTSQNDSLALRAACYIIERVEAATVGVTDVRAIFRAQCMNSLEDQAEDWSKSFDAAKYRRLCEDVGITP